MADPFLLNNDVTKGINTLNERGPGGWLDLINPDTLDIESSDQCILGQCYGNYIQGISLLGLSDPYNYGFAGADHLPVWQARIRELQTPRTAPQVEPSIPVRERELVTV